MNPPVLIALFGVFLVIFVFSAIWAARYVKVGPNQVLVVSGRRQVLRDGTVAGVRFVTGGTMVLPVIEQVAVLSLEVMTITLPRLTARTAKQEIAEVECVAHVKINSDAQSLAFAAEHFLTKTPEEIKAVVASVLEKHIRAAISAATLAGLPPMLPNIASGVETSASASLGKMGVGLISLKLDEAQVPLRA